MLADMSSEDLTYWQAVDHVRPIDPTERIIEQVATLCCIVANANGAKSKIQDFMPWDITEADGHGMDANELVESMPGGSEARNIVDNELAELEAWRLSKKEN